MNIIKFVVVAIILAFFASSCQVRYVDAQTGRPIGQQQVGYQGQGGQQQGVQRRLDSVNVIKSQTGHCEARIWQGSANTPANVQRVADYASSVYECTGSVPSEQQLTAKFGFRAQARWIDTPDRVVGKVTVRPDEVPASIRARFQ
jgi:hypothetical protein